MRKPEKKREISPSLWIKIYQLDSEIVDAGTLNPEKGLIYNILEDNFELLLVNAQHIKAVPGRKTDVKDSEWIADLLRHGLLKASFVPPKGQRELRELTRFRTTFIRERATLLNRIQKALESANIKLASVVTNIEGVSGRAMVEAIIDSLPIPTVQFHLVPSSTGDWKAFGATFGKVTTKKQTIFGYRLHLLISLSGLILDFELTPANCTDLEAGFEMLCEHTDLEVLGDKAYISAAKAADLWENNRIRLRTIPRANQKQQASDRFRYLHNAIRQLIETVNSQLSGQLGIEKNYAHSFWGLCTRLYSKLTAHTLCIYLNRLLGKPNFLQIKALAFPN